MYRNALNALLLTCALPVAAAAAPAQSTAPAPAPVKLDKKQVERGRYLVKIAGCNDCHTPGYAQTGGKVPEAQWLTGDKLGWRGPWGTTYPVNLRLYMAGLSQQAWVQRAKTTEMRPPMPWFALRDMTDQDLNAIYQYVRSLGPAGEPAPAFVSRGSEPRTPVVQFPMP